MHLNSHVNIERQSILNYVFCLSLSESFFSSSEYRSRRDPYPKGKGGALSFGGKAGIDLLHKSLKRLAGSAGNVVKTPFMLLVFC